jgi:hypothetical protein
MQIAKTIYSGMTAHRLAMGTGVLAVTTLPLTSLFLRLSFPEPGAYAVSASAHWSEVTYGVLTQLSAAAFAYRWHPACTLLPLGVFGLFCVASFGPKKDSAGKQLPHVTAADVAFVLEYLAVVGHLTAAARGLGGSNRFFKIAAMAVAGVGQAALTVIGVVIYPEELPESDEG